MRLFIAIPILIAGTQTAFAECATRQDTFLSCTFSNGRKAVDVCVEGKNLTYRFGRVGKAPDLALSVSVIDAEYTPWPGVSSSIWETVTFQNQETRYEVTGAINRIYPENENEDIGVELSGYIEVIAGGETQATLNCDAGSVDFAYGGSIYDAKKAAGQCWMFEERFWAACK
jgi:hypothetical protein